MASAPVIALRGGTVPGAMSGPTQEVIALLEEALADAKAGRVHSVAIAYTIEDGDPQPLTKTAWHHAERYAPHLWFAVTHLVERIKHGHSHIVEGK